jgi:hypothetical protein
MAIRSTILGNITMTINYLQHVAGFKLETTTKRISLSLSLSLSLSRFTGSFLKRTYGLPVKKKKYSIIMEVEVPESTSAGTYPVLH